MEKVPKQALTVGVGTVMDAKEVMILITGAHKAFALYKTIEEGVSHMWTVSAFQVWSLTQDYILSLKSPSTSETNKFAGCNERELR